MPVDIALTRYLSLLYMCSDGSLHLFYCRLGDGFYFTIQTAKIDLFMIKSQGKI